MKTKSYYLIITSSLLFFLFTMQKGLAQSIEKMEEAINSMNESCPLMVDKDTRCDSVIILNDNIIQYNYTLINHAKRKLNLERIKNAWVPNLIEQAKVSPDLKKFRENNVTLSYNYKDKNGKHIIKVEVTPSMYAD